MLIFCIFYNLLACYIDIDLEDEPFEDSENETPSNWGDLPDLLLEEIFYYLNMRERYYCSMVCLRLFNKITFKFIQFLSALQKLVSRVFSAKCLEEFSSGRSNADQTLVQLLFGVSVHFKSHENSKLSGKSGKTHERH